MALPEFSHLKREQEKVALKALLMRTLIASFAIHGSLLLLHFKPIWIASTVEPEDIAIVVTEDESPEIEQEEEPLAEELLTGSGSPISSAAMEPIALTEPSEAFALLPHVQEPTVQEPTVQEPTVQEPTVQEPTVQEPTVESSPVPTENSPQDRAEDLSQEPVTESSPPPTPQQTEAAAPALPTPPTPQRSIQDLLEQIRRDLSRQQSSSEASNGSSTTVDTPVIPSRNGAENNSGDGAENNSGDGSRNSSLPGNRSNSGNSESGTERGNEATAPIAPPSTGRRISCRNCPDVEYPEEALREQQEGTVKVLVNYDENGRVVGATLVDSSGHTVLDEAVLETVRERYHLNDSSGAGSTVLTVDMTIDGSDLNRRAVERGSRREVTMPPAPVVEEPPTPRNAAVESVTPTDPVVTDPVTSPVAPTTPVSSPEPAPAPQETAPPVAPPAPQPSNPVEAIEPILEEAPSSVPATVEPGPAPPSEPVSPDPEPIAPVETLPSPTESP